jgi:hypothetical protein
MKDLRIIIPALVTAILTVYFSINMVNWTRSFWRVV